MKKHIMRIVPVVVFIAALLAGAKIRIDVDQIGVKTNQIGLWGRGIVARDFGPGWHMSIPFMHKWIIMPAHVRRVEMTKDSRQRSDIGEDALIVQSSDGDRVLVDLTIFYRIKPGSAHRLLQDSGPGDAHVRVLKTIANDRLRAVLGTLRTELFYSPEARREKIGQALAEMKEPLGRRHLEIVDLQIKDVEFEPKYEQKIKEKALADQNAELNKAQRGAAIERGKVAAIRIETNRQVQLIEANTRAHIDRIKAEAEKYAAEQRAIADLYASELRAEGNLAVVNAEAKVKQAKASALTGSGGSNYAALEAVKNFKVDSISFPTGGRDWFDVHEMAKRLGARP